MAPVPVAARQFWCVDGSCRYSMLRDAAALVCSLGTHHVAGCSTLGSLEWHARWHGLVHVHVCMFRLAPLVASLLNGQQSRQGSFPAVVYHGRRAYLAGTRVVTGAACGWRHCSTHSMSRMYVAWAHVGSWVAPVGLCALSADIRDRVPRE